MAAHLIVASFLALLCIAQPGLSRPEQAAGMNFEQLLNEMKTSVDKAVADAKKSLNLPNEPNGEAIVKAFREQSQKLENSLKETKSKIEKEMKDNPQVQEMSKNLKAKFDEFQANLKKQNPEVAAGAQKAMDGVKSGYESLIKEMERIHAEVNKKGGLRDDMENLMKGIIDKGAAAMKEFSAKIQEASKKN